MPDRSLLPVRAGTRGEPPIRLLIVDDSIVARTVLGRILDDGHEFRVAALVPGVVQAFALLDAGLDVDVILLDLEMPGIDGLTALPELIRRSDGARVLIVSSTTATGAAATVRALTLGAAETLLKPSTAQLNGRFAEDLAETLRRIGRTDRRSDAMRRGVAGAARRGSLRCLAVGASTGGPHALAAFFGALKAPIGVPILVTQHLPASFLPVFAGQLGSLATRRCTVATSGALLVADEILLAPGDAHIGLMRIGDEVRVRLDRRPATSGCMPSVDPMLRAVAEIYGTGACAVILSGMGRDGALGAAALAKLGGEVLAQDAATSVVWGMPGAVADAVSGATIAPPEALARHLASASAARG